MDYLSFSTPASSLNYLFIFLKEPWMQPYANKLGKVCPVMGEETQPWELVRQGKGVWETSRGCWEASKAHLLAARDGRLVGHLPDEALVLRIYDEALYQGQQHVCFHRDICKEAGSCPRARSPVGTQGCGSPPHSPRTGRGEKGRKGMC